MRTRVPQILQGPLLVLAYIVVRLCLWPTTTAYWDLVSGLRFALPLLLPFRYWPWLLMADWGGTAILDLGLAGLGPGMFFTGSLTGMPIAMAGIALARRFGISATLDTPEQVVQLLGTALFVTLLGTAVQSSILLAVHPTFRPITVAGTLGSELLGDYLGMLLLTPMLVFLVRDRPPREEWKRLLQDGLMIFLPALIMLFILLLQGSPLSRFARTLALALVLYFAFRHGWRGSAISMLLISLTMTGLYQLTAQPDMPAQDHLFTAVAGTATLMLGSAIDALRRSSLRLGVQNRRLEAANRRLDHLAVQLSNAARRNLRSEEEQRRHLAGELHDELGQNLTAIQTRVKLAQGRLHGAGLDDIAASINEILMHMRVAVRRMLDNLRPSVLDEFGLARALEEGPIQDLLHSAGIEYRFRMHGDPHRLDDDTRTAIYRVAQEAVTNAVRHARATRMHIHLRIGRRGAWHLVLLDIRDNGVGLAAGGIERPGGHGLQSMRDRVTALGGIFRVRPVERGTRLRVLLRAPAHSRTETPNTPPPLESA